MLTCHDQHKYQNDKASNRSDAIKHANSMTPQNHAVLSHKQDMSCSVLLSSSHFQSRLLTHSKMMTMKKLHDIDANNRNTKSANKRACCCYRNRYIPNLKTVHPPYPTLGVDRCPRYRRGGAWGWDARGGAPEVVQRADSTGHIHGSGQVTHAMAGNEWLSV